MKNMLFVTLLAILFIFGVTPIGYAGNPLPPPPDGTEYNRWVGPDITGTLTFINYEKAPGEWTTSATITGECKKNKFGPVSLPDQGALFDVVCEDYLLGTGIYEEDGPPVIYAPYECSPSKEYAFPVVYKVLKFSQPDPNTKVFKIIGKFIYPTPY